ncbi:btz [Drosophila busckii]|uniref:Protein CASC3 n=1 Tax=Drosophila busckii TaxID=30019 RepID=A0A0M4EQW8_DROBS|nr:btz [Drosophila busckii]
MAEVEKMTASAPSDIPISSPHEADTGAAANNTIELGTSPTQEPSSNSLPHDSEYDTASDLEGGEDYDDDESGSGSEDETETESDDEEEDGVGSSGTVSGNGMERGVADSEAQKKVDEDRSNPQYIPKRGTFYEHDDRTAEEGGAGPEAGTESSQINVEPNGGDAPNGVLNIGAATVGQSPTISHASKTMKKWQAASGGDRWSHDRFEANEQAPKSRAELLQTYGYDIRNEDAAPRARRRRRYGRGPSKYSRNWEDEQAYLKASNKERKPPRPQDFPALNEHGSSGSRKLRRPRTSTSREEKENRGERRGTASGSNNAAITISSGLPPKLKEALDRERDRELERERERERERIPSERDRDGKNRNYGRANGGQGSSSRQNAMDFKQKSNRGPQREPVPVPVPVSVSVPVAQTSYVNPASAGYLPPTPAAVAYAQAQSPQPAPAAPQPTTQAAQAPPPSINYHQNYNTVGGTTYFVPPVQAPTRPAVLPQRRPTNAIPILPPSEKHKTRNANSKADSEPPSGSADNIDHIIDNMFVQRPAFQPPGEPTEDVAGAQNTAVVADLNHQAVAVPGQE